MIACAQSLRMIIYCPVPFFIDWVKVNAGQIFIFDKSPPWQRFHSSPPSIDNHPES